MNRAAPPAARRTAATLYARAGDVFLAACVLVLLAGGAATALERARGATP